MIHPKILVCLRKLKTLLICDPIVGFYYGELKPDHNDLDMYNVM